MSALLQTVSPNTYNVNGLTVRKQVNGKFLVACGTVHETITRSLPAAIKRAQEISRGLL